MRKPAKRFQDLLVWQRAHQLVLSIYKETRAFPVAERYGLTIQLRRAATSIPANIAEGFRKRSRRDKARFYNIGQGSLEETRYYLIIAHDLGYMDSRQLLEDTQEVSRLLAAYTRPLLTTDY